MVSAMNPFLGLIMGWDKTKIRHIPIEVDPPLTVWQVPFEALL